MEVQLTDFENAAFAVFIVLLSRAILSFGLNLYIPISKVDENMHTAQKRDAARSEKFYFRKNVYTTTGSPGSSTAGSTTPSTLSEDALSGNGGYVKRKEKKLRNCFPAPPKPASGTIPRPVEDEYELMTLQEIMLGKVRIFSPTNNVAVLLKPILFPGRRLSRSLEFGLCILRDVRG